MLKNTIEEMHKIARDRGGKCLSIKYINNATHLLWECADGHQWKAIPSSIKRGGWCPICGGSAPLTIEEMHRIADDRGGKCLSEKYINAKTHLSWECANGHQWSARPGNVKRGQWCAVCARLSSVTIEDMRVIARDRGGECLSTKYINNAIHLMWACADGHQWRATPNKIKGGRWCPICANSSSITIEEMQAIAHQRGGQCISARYISSRTHLLWECKKGHKWKAAPSSVKLGTWCPVCARISSVTIEDMHKIAHERGGKCLSTQYINSQTHLLWECEKGHQWQAIPNKIRQGRWCHVCSGWGRLTIEEMQEIARDRGGVCLSEEYINSDTNLQWACKDGHGWEATPDNVKRGTWCPVCACRVALTIEEMNTIARKRGGKCISTSYIDARTHLLWECERGHRWQATPDSVKRVSWCPECAKLARCKSDKARARYLSTRW